MSSATANQPFVFTPGSAPAAAAGMDPLVNETRREISEIVREVAAAVRSDRTADEFLTLLVDRILRAMAAEGVMVWRRSNLDQTAYDCVCRLGRTTDQSIPAQSMATHRQLLLEVSEGQPVVVPATPGATDGDVPANPMEVPVALVPIECERTSDGSEYLLEVFLEPGCGVATQRGYLRFVAQMADLAGEFLRANQLRSFRRMQTLARSVDTAIFQMHEIHDRRKLEAAIVDLAADLFGFDRVGLCATDPKTALAAVSHVNAIDRNSPAARQLREAAELEIGRDGCLWLDEVPCESSDEQSLVLRAVTRSIEGGSRRLVGMQTTDAEPVTQECHDELVRYMQHAELSLNNVARWDAIPGGRLFASLAPTIQSHRRGWKSLLMTVVVMTLLIAVTLFPVPLVVYSTASIRPAIVQSLTAPRDAVVDQVHVRHGQEVTRGELILTMSDPDLEEQITDLVGRRSVSIQKQSHWTSALVDTPSTQFDRLEQVQGEQRLVAEEIQSIDDQLAILARVQESLRIRAGRDGVVDAWQIEQRLQSRPLRRGDALLQIVAKDSPWMVDVRVPQSRIAHVQNANKNQELSARVSLESNPNESFVAELKQIGPAVITDQDSIPTTAVLLGLSDRATRMVASSAEGNLQSGAPARVMFHCGKTPAAYFLFQDVIRSLRGTLALYIATDTEQDPHTHGDR